MWAAGFRVPAGAEAESALTKMSLGTEGRRRWGSHPALAPPHRGWPGQKVSAGELAGSGGPGQVRSSLSTVRAWAWWGVP